MALSQTQKQPLPILALAALGVVFGDIGTSPLYAVKEAFHAGEHGVKIDEFHVFGIASLILWSLISVVTIKYVIFILRADNRGEGGILSMLALLLDRVKGQRTQKAILTGLGLLGATLFFGDGMITPAISVLSAVEGLEVAAPQLHQFIVPLTIIILTFLFAVQSQGTSRVGVLFGPITLLWFVVLGALGIWHIISMPDVLKAINPLYGIKFLFESTGQSLLVLGSVVLCVTGAEALYADLGHFGRGPIRLGWSTIVLPGLALNYLGQSALLLKNPEAVENPFYLMVPEWGLYPMIFFATIVTVIASQAVISGVFSVTHQAMQLGYLPRYKIKHTTASEEGQIYMPGINWMLFLAVIFLVMMFRSSENLASAYGLAVTGDMVVATTLFAFVTYKVWRWPLWLTIAITILFLSFEIPFLSANILKIPHGAWLPILIGALLFTIMTTWKKGRKVMYNQIAKDAAPWGQYFRKHDIDMLPKVPGSAVYMYFSTDFDRVPMTFSLNVDHNKVRHEQVIFLSVVNEHVPRVYPKDRISVVGLMPGVYKVILRYGYMQEPNIPLGLKLAEAHDLHVDIDNTTFFMGRIRMTPAERRNISSIRAKLFDFLNRNSANTYEYFRIPPNRVVELSKAIEF
ncbi:MAG: potassium transporter Kup [Alphaproteobacteria bacterium]|nr:potassium transporter Kup [Alphaproteobacteria bacterium]